jgi:hypothetical protein
MMLSPNFDLSEFIVSQYASRFDIDNRPRQPIIDNLTRLCVEVLEPLRAAVKKPIIISSGYRSLALNKAIGGASNSAHTLGLAADITVPGITNRTVCFHILTEKIKFDQLIDEFGSWVHVSIAAKNAQPRGQRLEARRQTDGKTIYKPASFL